MVCRWILGLSVSLLLGGVITWLFLFVLRRGLGSKPATTSGIPAWLTGGVERLFFTLLVAMEVNGVPTAMVAWIGIKMAANWNRAGDDATSRRWVFSALLAGLLSMLFAYLGGWIILGIIPVEVASAAAAYIPPENPMSTLQTIFALFFAIFWGAVANMQGRWKMFQPIMSKPFVRNRFALSFVLLNVVPVFYFAWTFARIGSIEAAGASSLVTFIHLLGAVFSAFAIFAIYRFWMWIVDLTPDAYYQRKTRRSDDMELIHDPTIEDLGLATEHRHWNLLFAIVYLLIAVLSPLLIGI